MIRLAISVEGATEREFVTRTLAPWLLDSDIAAEPILLRGPPNLDRIAAELKRLLWNFDRVSTLYDYYGFYQRGKHSPDTLAAAIGERAPPDQRDRLIPYVQQYEFEALIFAVPKEAAEYMGHPDVTGRLQDIVRKCGGPEDIDNGRDTCPSRRLQGVFPEWDKTLHGPGIIHAAGIDRVRAACPRFDGWIDKLLACGATAQGER